MNEGFHFSQFVGGTAVIVWIPTILASIYFALRHQAALRKDDADEQSSPRRFGLPQSFFRGGLIAFSCGLLIPAAWLTWNPQTGFDGLLQHGPPTQFPKWQVYSCGATIVVAAVLVTVRYATTRHQAFKNAIYIGAGFGTAFGIAGSFDVSPQAGIGVLLSFVGISLLAVLVSGVAYMAIRLRQKPRGRELAGRR